MKRITKKDLIFSLHEANPTVEEIAHALECHPLYVANILEAAGKAPNGNGLYMGEPADGRAFQGIIRFRDVEAARRSVRQLDTLYRQARAEGDLPGQQRCQLMALVGRNRAEGTGKYAEAQIFADWLKDHIDAPALPAELAGGQLSRWLDTPERAEQA